MRLSYENDLARLLTGAREKLFQGALEENGLQEDDGELFTHVPADSLLQGLFALGQGVTRIEDLGLWTKNRVENTFADDLKAVLIEAAGADNVEEGHKVPNLPGAENYPVDFCIHTPAWPLYVFGVTNKDKARLATIILQHLTVNTPKFNSMIVCSDMDSLPKSDLKRLLVAANDCVPSIDERAAIMSKIGHRMLAA